MRKLKQVWPELSEEALLLEPEYYDEACIGFAERASGQTVAVYDYNQLVLALMINEDWSAEEAHEWVDFNIVGAWMGPETPLYINVGEVDYDSMRNDYRYHKLKEKEGW